MSEKNRDDKNIHHDYDDILTTTLAQQKPTLGQIAFCWEANKTNRELYFIGAGSGIGQATAVEFFRKSYNVVLTGRTEEKLQKTVAMFKSEGSTTDDVMSKVRRFISGLSIKNKTEIQSLSTCSSDIYCGLINILSNWLTALNG